MTHVMVKTQKWQAVFVPSLENGFFYALCFGSVCCVRLK